jgi:hypothetical protein
MGKSADDCFWAVNLGSQMPGSRPESFRKYFYS